MVKDIRSGMSFFSIIALTGVLILSILLLSGCNDEDANLEDDQEAEDLFPGPVIDIPQYQDAKNVVVYYDSSDSDKYAQGKMKAAMLANLLGHFKTNVTLENVLDYRPNDILDYDAGFYLGVVDNNMFHRDFLNDIYDNDVPFYWIGANFFNYHVKRAYDPQQRFGISYIGNIEDEVYEYVSYKGYDLDRVTTDTYFVAVEPSLAGKCQSVATLKNSIRTRPLIMDCGNFWYMSDDPFAYMQGEYLAFADSLHEFLGTDIDGYHRAVLRVDGVSPINKNYEQMRLLAMRLEDKGVPFSISVVPQYHDGEGIHYDEGESKSLSKSKMLVKALTYMQKKNGTVIANGYTHQNQGTTFLDYEFWDMDTNAPLAKDSWKWATERAEASKAAFEDVGYAASIWHTPSYFASYSDYFAIATRFNAVFDRLLMFDLVEKPSYGNYIPVGDATFKWQTMPYFIHKSFYGFKVIPENLGYLAYDQYDEFDHKLDVETIRKNARDHLVIRDGVVGLRYFMWESEEDLFRSIKLIQDLGYIFVDVEDVKNTIPPSYETFEEDGDVDGDEDGDSDSEEIVYCNANPDLCPSGQGCVNGKCSKCQSAFQCPDYDGCHDGVCGDCRDNNECRPGEMCSKGFCMPTHVPQATVTLDPAVLEHMLVNFDEQIYYDCVLSQDGLTYNNNEKIRLHGYSSRKKYPKKSFRVMFPEDAGHPGYTRKINYKADYNDPTYMRTMLSFATSRRLTSVPTPRVRYRQLTFQVPAGAVLDESNQPLAAPYYSNNLLMMEVERIGGSFLEDHMRDRDGALYDADKAPRYGGLVPLDDTDDYENFFQRRGDDLPVDEWRDMLNLVEGILWDDYQNSGLEGLTVLNRTEPSIHIESYIEFIASMTLIQNLDTVEANFAFSYQTLDGKDAWEFYPWDMDISFGCQWNSVARNALCTDMTSEMWWLAGTIPDGVQAGPPHDVWCNMLIHLVLNHPTTRRMYEDKLCEYIHSDWWNKRIQRMIDALGVTLEPFAREDYMDYVGRDHANDDAEVWDEYEAYDSEEEWQAEWQHHLDNIKQFIENRKVYLEDQLRCWEY